MMRNDMDSLNPGKACAQASHAANEAVASVEKTNRFILDGWYADSEEEKKLAFGTVIVMEGSEKEILDEIAVTKGVKGIIKSGITIDPTYPIKDGDTMHHFPIMTCAWAWVSDENFKFNLVPMK